MKKCNKIFGIFLSCALIITGSMLPQNNSANAAAGKDYGIRAPRVENGVTTWDKITFGSYYQKAEAQNAPIKWRVLSVDSDNALLLADKNLDSSLYNDTDEDVTWETCTLRKWLNEEFYNEAFDEDEKKAVMESSIENSDNGDYGTYGGNDTKDRVYLLSNTEICNASYGFEKELNAYSRTRMAQNTDYAKVNNVWSTFDNDIGNGWWWLRSPGIDSCQASVVGVGGNGLSAGNKTLCIDGGVRPAIRVKLSSDKVTYAGRVNSEGITTVSGNGIHNPVTNNGVTTWDCVYFGNYRQNCKFDKQALEWRVLSVDGDDAFLLADKVIDVKQYNEERGDVTWENCGIRKWLNSDFYNNAFNDEEKTAVKETTVKNTDNEVYESDGGADTKDKVYLLSVEEVCRADYGFDTQFKGDSKTREAKGTDYAKINNVKTGLDYITEKSSYWMLRTPGVNNSYISQVIYGGFGDDYGIYAESLGMGVRPALHIHLSSSSWSKAGQVSSVEQVDDNPSLTPEPTKKPSGIDQPSETDKPVSSTGPVQEVPVTSLPLKHPASTDNSVHTTFPVLKKLKISSVKCIKNARKVTGKLSVSKADVRIKVGNKAYKKASVKGKKFTLRFKTKLKKKTKITVKVTKKGYESLVKAYKVK
ncbi:MAG: hypothetical protein HFH14_05350 [Lachnospiraceae bacterium]|nr:hypothetical protein [Lachnospiraceae bacterium]